MEDVCYTREAALERAIETEAASFKVYRDTYVTAKDRLAKDEEGHLARLEKLYEKVYLKEM